jgi:hypothetical protein
MKRLLIIAGLLSVLVVGAPPAAAHEDYRVIGTITKVTAETIDVKQTKDDKTVSMAMTQTTRVTRDTTTVGATELEAGLSVVVDARGDSLEALRVTAVKIVPTLAQQ